MIEVDLKKSLNGAGGKFTLELRASFAPKKLHAIFGESGSGKSTFFRMLSGLATPDSGRILQEKQIFFDKSQKINLPTWKRKIGFVFQDSSLFPHLNVYKNLVFGLDPALKDHIHPLISLLNLEHLCDKSPRHLSGGQSQKVALARAILHNPSILLLDEPFSGLDQNSKTLLQQELKKLLSHFPLTTFLISHDISEVFFLADEVFVLENGRFSKSGSPQQVFLQNSHHSSAFCGEILQIDAVNQTRIAQVLVQDIILQILLREDQKSLKIGDRILLENHLICKNIQKI
ncbi:ATP-binding cassette domain-containing protein [Helicobacter mustelae]|uniref:Putative molybdenum transport ATP-binding protein n=1 Tax=Helicobacter mustelae (strain ATCC 43772 / CCUG 25715 / CIP 103759 / LMG 18044 / NCTC 12198 / R85-136P) TaxID=679897 RepID=D3UJ71_HELM1|nr:ATP-binding cassette domain-containing protein [Helicobacter mustelae]CBG40546.1 putative molybdenum transport ATP-binding protein [Helicobacter mustelae 12198]SQH72044.1 molybdenum transport ATP-binding protein [Helicobacter mustelae]STP13187.1 molybdenum transport ATP-binding protein [Helicobacter mustelae]